MTILLLVLLIIKQFLFKRVIQSNDEEGVNK